MWLDYQIEVLLFFQKIRYLTNGIFDNFFLFITHFGESTLPLFMIACIYWCINSRFAMTLYCNLAVGTFVCDLLKNIACIYRPWILDNRIQPVPEALKMAHGYSFPSGHTQNAVSVWGVFALEAKNKIIKILFILLILLVALSRNYLGVHTPQDVLVALFFTTLILFLMTKFEKWINNRKNRDIIIYLIFMTAAFLFLLFTHFKSYPIDYINGEILVDPIKMKINAFPKMGLFTGVFTGWLINRRFIHFDGSIGTLKEKIIIFLYGALIYWFLYFNLKPFLINFTELKYAMFLSSFILTTFAIVIYPIIITLIRKNKQKTKC